VILDDILAHKADEVSARKHATPMSELRARPLYAEPRRGFRATLAARRAPAVIAELKRASPSKGVIRTRYEPLAHARAYGDAGAAALSVLTDERFFEGHLDHLAGVRGVVALPCLRKDFLVDLYQVTEARAYGADAVLVIAAAGSASLRVELLAAAREEGLDVLVEVHDERELEWAVAAGATLVGINNRDLSTFVVSLETTERLAALVPAGTLVVAESGMSSAADVRRMVAAGAHGVLIGEAFMAAPDPGAALAEFLR
jgi:indole-3-glycerol phosphate synthase